MIRRALTIAAIGAAFVASSRSAGAFCRSRTCGKNCTLDEFKCPVEGVPLAWRGRCTSYSIQRDDIPSISHIELRDAADAAFRAWQEAGCSPQSQSPAISVSNPFGLTACSHVEYNGKQANANIIVLRQTWESAADSVLALTTVSFDTRTGEILDADIEVNGSLPITAGPVGPNQFDLQSILTHEAGHFLGLAHSPVGQDNGCENGATMCPLYRPGTEAFRSLEEDDIAGICAVYPPGREAPACDASPRRGFSPECGLDPATGGCAIGVLGAGSHVRALPLVLVGLGLSVRRWRLTRRRAQNPT